jgi:hypothetical protein
VAELNEAQTAAEHAAAIVNDIGIESGALTVVAGWILLVDRRGLAADGDEGSGIEIVYPDGGLPWSQTIGVLRAASVRVEHTYTRLVLDDD